jgi:phosphopentomutase
MKAGATPSKGDFRGDPFTARLALDYLHEKLPRFLFISLGEADAYGHGNNYPAYVRALRRSDAFVGELMLAIDELNSHGHRTTLLVTTDHGRDANAREHGPWAPETGRVWLFAGGFGVPARGAVALPDARVLADVAPSIRRLLGVPSADPGGATRRGLPELFEPRF